MPLSPAARRRILIAVVVLVLGVAAGVAFAWHLTRQRPEWWHEVPREAPATVGRAEQVENAVVSELSRARPAESAPQTPYRSPEWTLTITEDEANAWLATRARDWLENRGMTWPGAVDDVQVSFREQQIAVGVRVLQPGLDRVIGMTGVPVINSEGVWLRVDGMSVGDLPLPRGFVIDQLQHHLTSQEAADVLGVLEGRRPIIDEPLIPLGDGRVVRIMGLRVEAGRVVAVCRTEKPAPQSPTPGP